MISRRELFKRSSVGAGLLCLGVVPGVGVVNLHAAEKENLQLHTLIAIGEDSRIHFSSIKHEMGQGISTGLSTVIADEIGTQLNNVELHYMEYFVGRLPADRRWSWVTGGSFSIRSMWPEVRNAAAAVREMLLTAAAKVFAVQVLDCAIEGDTILNRVNAKTMTLAQAAKLAVNAKVPEKPQLKANSQFKLIGKSDADNDFEGIVEGKQVYGIDFASDGMLYANVSRSPTLGGKLKSFDDSLAKKIPGVVKVFAVKGKKLSDRTTLQDGVIVLAENTWAAIQGKKALKLEWQKGEYGDYHQNKLFDYLDQALLGEKQAVIENGKTNALTDAPVKIKALYQIPYQSHVPMEPLCANVKIENNRCDVWAANQDGYQITLDIAEATGIPEKNIVIHNMRSGGAFGRRFIGDYFAEAALAAKEANGLPVQLLFTREDDIQNDAFHPAYAAVEEAGIENGQCIAWRSVKTSGDTVARDWNIYQVPNLFSYGVKNKQPLATGPWRSVEAHLWAFSQESFIDEVANASGKDPAEFRLALLKQDEVTDIKHWSGDKTDSRRYRNVFKLAMEKANWGKAKQGIYQGIAGYPFMHGNSYCAMVVEVSKTGSGIKLERVVVAADCGLIVNPEKVAGQIEGGVIWGLSAALYGAIEVEEGAVKQSNFHDYPVARMNQVPPIEVHFIQERDTPDGVGELAVPPVAPALMNAVYAATKQRVRSFPLSKTGLV
ncbi:xanthine dehydrogenase family protein molybdopterin-binding subunit [Teredinibacter sp. KSP-S5-2]|uniref:xanthine dehydrogenase family protein molybdopterin-binding subunit n=1 Tax=Teredinibacter sp. KSP-S5-2 TaxID=3034506 RepID=UPI002934C7F2|nr:molybdopterin cofactor-binding domain-containing protein [Teredinibacter sp. KSP-S5-2]WNO08480.1 molybdopterin-dependent oxidoreductase [Teredinibacter sp. KSP-S5-2]